MSQARRTDLDDDGTPCIAGRLTVPSPRWRHRLGLLIDLRTETEHDVADLHVVARHCPGVAQCILDADPAQPAGDEVGGLRHGEIGEVDGPFGCTAGHDPAVAGP